MRTLLRQPPVAEETARVKTPLQILFAAVDDRIHAAWLGYEPALKAGGAKYEAYIYAGTQHGFNNDTTPRFDAAAAKLAWDRTMGFLRSSLGKSVV